MDFSFTEEQHEVVGLARTILEDLVDHESLTALEALDEPRFDATLWAALASANLLGIGLPVEVGGSGLGVLAQSLVLEEIGRTLAPVPYLASIAMAADAVATFGTPAQIDAWVRPAIDGTKILTAALAEPFNRDQTRPTTTAVADGGGWCLNGVKTTVPAGTIADVIAVTASLGGESDRGTAVFLVDPTAAGVTVTAQDTATHEPFAQVEFRDVFVGDEALLGGDTELGAAMIARLIERATIGLCATQLGVTEKALWATADYTKERVQFNRPIATFQAVGHRCADAYIDVEGIRLTLWQAIYSIETGSDASIDVQTAKFWASEGGHRIAHAIVHLHGGMGIATEYFIHRYFAFAKQIEFSLGGATEQAMRIGAQLAAATTFGGPS
ncbi:MAG TPA: acyl-CoA dehydrogenase family protein [Ilumatobacter sp.]|nr:acyl-CoA dehydrogenase family protein [Ilumatobacter sp.]